MKKKVIVEEQKNEDPQALLEKIMKAEVASAEGIAEVRKQAEKKISTAQENAEKSKKEAYASGRRTRSRLVEKGLEKARKEAQEKVLQSENKVQNILEDGREFIPAAVTISLNFILSKVPEEESHDQ